MVVRLRLKGAKEILLDVKVTCQIQLSKSGAMGANGERTTDGENKKSQKKSKKSEN